MATLSVEEIIVHCNLPDDVNLQYIEVLAKAALEKICDHINAVLFDTDSELESALSSENPPTRAFVIDSQTKVAAWMLIEHFFNNRSALSEEGLKSLPYGVSYLLSGKVETYSG